MQSRLLIIHQTFCIRSTDVFAGIRCNTLSRFVVKIPVLRALANCRMGSNYVCSRISTIIGNSRKKLLYIFYGDAPAL